MTFYTGLNFNGDLVHYHSYSKYWKSATLFLNRSNRPGLEGPVLPTPWIKNRQSNNLTNALFVEKANIRIDLNYGIQSV